MPAPILFVHYGDEWIRGSERVLLDLFAYLDRRRFEPILWCNSEILAAAARGIGVHTICSEMRYFFMPESPRFSLKFFSLLQQTGRDLISRHKIELVHVNSAAPHQWMLSVARRLHLPVIVHLHADYLPRHRFGLLLHQATCAVGVAENVLVGLRYDGVNPKQLRIIANGIDPARLVTTTDDLRRELNIAQDVTIIGSVGSLLFLKGHDIVLRAFALLPTESKTQLLIVGDGPERRNLEALAQQLRISSRVHFLGSRNDMASVYKTIDLHVLATRFEAFGLVLVEAAMAGVPNIATRVGGVVDIIRDGDTGILVEPENVGAIANALRRLTSDLGACRRLGESARNDANARFSAATMCAQFQDLYDELIATPAKRHGWLKALRVRPYAGILGRIIRKLFR